MKHSEYNTAVKLFVLFFALSLVGCSPSYYEDIKRGSTYNYEPGLPELWFEPSGIITPEGKPKLTVAGTIPKGSLIYKDVDGVQTASISINIEVINTTADETLSDTFTAKILRKSDSGSLNDDLYNFYKTYDVKAGYFDVLISVMDQATGKMIVREDKSHIPVLKNGARNITNIRLLAKQKGETSDFRPIPTYDVNQTADSIKFEFQVANTGRKISPITFEVRLIKFRSDTTIASPMSSPNRAASSIEYKGIDLRNYEVIQRTERQLTQPGNVTVEFVFDNLPNGNYRFEVGQDIEEKDRLYKAREFAIKGDNYPLVQSPRELAEPLIYIMDPKEYEEMMQIKSNDSLKAAVDRFWLSNIQNSSLARTIISMYYHRVEEANKLFSNFKEGWKTDMGMVYILFGPPFFQTKSLNEYKWAYSYDLTIPEYNFTFVRNKSKSDVYPFEHYVLERDNIYFQLEYRVRELWKSGRILTATL
ncbi:MAG: GWxTD domain-containing protein [Balneola sp.]|nr:GWxTD domain-containing protein [Balneola sp.]|tara:strand:- start:73970 stop:75397 length:1428 start_codon:yes stop_codon:yes gene_type:complete